MNRATMAAFVLLFLPAIAFGMGQTSQQPAHPGPHKTVKTPGKVIPPPKSADGSPHQVFFIPVERGVKLEVLDWGGVGRPLILLAGIGYDAHVWDKFAPKLIDRYHVYGITRRGFGASSAPAPKDDNYSADRLGDDVLAVMDQLHIERPVLVGHAKAGQELSSIGSRHPERVAGLVYLDAAYSYAFYDAKHGDLLLDAIDLRKKLDVYLAAGAPDLKDYFTSLQSTLPTFERDVQDFQDELALMPGMPTRVTTPPPILVAIGAGAEKYTEIRAPSLAIFADPHNFGKLYADNEKVRQALILDDFARTSAQADAFQAGVPGSHVVRIPNATHMIFQSNEADVLREMNAFIDKLPF
jgi:pimeloyl-ACP methyl ester carboxylesterase